ncbi:Nulp1-pending protein-like protein [Macroventuria anomochaeta]|uniref:Nulp1-pending protein-like protein n=1 Tax=Macroventuria anomochaeta TaxID=301207 RepID=A0ACB6RWM1_9PLEO|nr:Nulp1-pending protein-like protein [Macroventuria anomochaeta]KAF2625544.1 Nulp1-pending protein-like protein [Macroventuria anomochaeta]
MSSRALRRAQKEQEEKELQEKLAKWEQEEEESEEEAAPKPQAKPSLFAMLGDAGGDGDEDDEDEDEDEDEQGEPAPKPVVESTPASNPSKRSKKKKKKKSKNKSKTATPQKHATDSGLDEIDQALLALKVTSSGKKGTDEPLTPAISEETQRLFSALSIDTTHLHAANEMKKLFGRTALQHADDDEPRQRQQQGIAARVNGRSQPGSRLTGLSLRRNIFIQGKEEWPRATSGGLGMEIVSKNDDGSVEYRFVHNTSYQETQRQFQVCVASMDPERMIQLLATNPYHISTLLQVSEIAKQQRDNASASDLLERALFAFGRSVHSTFSSALSAGKARLSFSRPENREFFLAIWRYIATLCVRATFRTALEWARLLLSLAPEDDPYCMRLLTDQLALRGRSPESLLSIAESDVLERSWKIPPNLAFSTSLAHLRLKEPVKARSTLKNAVREYPWLAARLCKELDISPIPKPVWGKEPHNDYQELLCRLYVLRAKDLWNTTEGTSLLVEICYSFDEPLADGLDPYWLADIDALDLARHVILSDDQSLISLLDTSVKERYTSVSDPLPPDDNQPSYDMASLAGPRGQRSAVDRNQLLSDLEDLRRYFQSIDIEALVGGGLTEENLVRALQEGGSSLDEFRRNSERFQVVRARLQDVGVQVVFQGENAEGAAQEEGSDTDE